MVIYATAVIPLSLSFSLCHPRTLWLINIAAGRGTSYREPTVTIAGILHVSLTKPEIGAQKMRAQEIPLKSPG